MPQIFEIPEILRLICEQTRVSDLARLLPTSRLFFGCAMPLVWKHLPRTAPILLMGLLHDIDKYPENNPNVTPIKDLQPMDKRSLARFNLYAPHVKSLFRSSGNSELDSTWGKLLRLVNTDTILPNLEGLYVMYSASYQEPVPDFALCFTGCLSPTLVDIHCFCISDLFITPKDLSELVSSIAQKCPRIRSLKLGTVAWQIPMESIHTERLVNSLGQLHNLRVLALGPVSLEPKVFTALSILPSLESLVLNEWNEKRGSEQTPKLVGASFPHGGFPSLQHLGISPCFTPEPAVRIWSAGENFPHLKSISVRINTPATLPQLCGFLRAICRCCPLVTALSFNFTHSTNHAELLSHEVIHILAQLPLRYLWLEGSFHSNDQDRENWNSEQFALAFPSMESLRIHGYYCTFADLVSIAKHMPRLQQLSAYFRLQADWPSRDELSLLAPTPSPSQLCFPLKIVEFMGWETHQVLPKEKVEAIAACLHALWPKGVVCETRLPPKDGKINNADEINAALGRLRESSGYSDRAEVIPQKYAVERVSPWFGMI